MDKASLPTSRSSSQRKSPSHNPSGQKSAVETQSVSGDSSTTSPAHSKNITKLSDDEAKRKCEENVSCILKEKDIEDAIRFYERVVLESNHPVVMNAIISRCQSISSQQDNYFLGTLLVNLIKRNHLYLSGLKQA